MSDRIKDLLRDAADGVEPGDRLDAIRAATSGRRRTGRGWWAAGGVGLAAASVVTALALTTGGTPRGTDPDPASPSPTTSAPTPVETQPPVGIYYIGDTPAGPRLYREVRTLEGADPLDAAVAAAVGNGPGGPGLLPLDPDYRVPWPSLTQAGAALDDTGDVIEIWLGGDPEADLRDRGALSEQEARLAVEQLVRTAQGVVGEPLPVRFLLYGELADQVLGVPTSEPLDAGSDLAVLAHVSLSAPSEGERVDNDEPFTVTGLGNSFEGNIVTRIQRWEGTYVVDQKPAIAGSYEDRLFPFEVTFDLTDVAPGEYVVISQTDDPSGEGRFDTDTRRITVVD
ncbi:Gmad2 immunoglobulin-like domain-containing protein [Nocardioides sp.]|uniref:Gmad2 immunoglobulin-like domain-containing protein n=1 Tax=Nocardioides sp. TaxID=35761 RepID=UPI0026038A0B|nr:Gmad2 immunoglobulin-like domain-containing protein [Nocardioides sp.]MCW2735650.1 hypothetical protein [Nocardioides sp.]